MVTGGGSGIGRSIALLFAGEGAHVVVADKVPSGAEQVVLAIRRDGRKGVFVQGDVGLWSDANAIVKETIREYGRLDILVNSAGIQIQGSVVEATEESWDEVIRVNLKGTFLMSKFAIPEMMKQGRGVVINLGSGAGLLGVAGGAAYCASKAAVVVLTKQVAVDYGRYGIRVNCLCPGIIDTSFNDRLLELTQDPVAERKKLEGASVFGRLGTPEDVAHAALYLASDEAAFVTGLSLVVDGGMLAGIRL